MSLWLLLGFISMLGVGGALVLVIQAIAGAGRDAASKIAAPQDSAKAETEAAKTADEETKKAVAEVQSATVDSLLARLRELRERGRSGK